MADISKVVSLKEKYPNSLDITGQGRICRCPCQDAEEDGGEEEQAEEPAAEPEVTLEEEEEDIDECDILPPFPREIIPPDFYRHCAARPLRVPCYPPKPPPPPPPCAATPEAEVTEVESESEASPADNGGGADTCATCPVWRPKGCAMPQMVIPPRKIRCFDPHQGDKPKKTRCYPY